MVDDGQCESGGDRAVDGATWDVSGDEYWAADIRGWPRSFRTYLSAAVLVVSFQRSRYAFRRPGSERRGRPTQDRPCIFSCSSI